MVFPDDNRTTLDAINLFTSTVAGLPRAGVRPGTYAYATDGRRPGEGAGEGTGIPIWADPDPVGYVRWRRFTDNAEVEA